MSILNEIKLTLLILERPDGGLRICSEELPGLILSGPDPVKVCAKIWPAVVALRAATAEK